MELEKDYSCLAKNVLVANKIINSDKSYQETIESYLDDIFKIVKCSCHSYVTSCDINDNTLVVYGKTKICLTYTNEENELLFADFLEDFSEKLTLENLSDSAFANVVACDKYCNFRVINQRRIDIHSSFQLNIKVYDRKTCSMLNNCKNSKLNKIGVNEVFVENSVIERIDFEEEIQLNSTNDGIKRVISYDAQIRLLDDKTVKDKIFVKAGITVNILYTNNKNEIEKLTHNFDVSKIFEVVGIGENSKCFLNLYEGCFYLKAKSYTDNANSKIELYGDLYTNIVVLCEEKREVIIDAYVVGHEMENTYSDYVCCTNPQQIENKVSEKFSIKTTQNIKKIVSLCVQIKQCSKKGNKFLVELGTDMIFENHEGELQYFSNTREIACNCEYELCVVLKAYLNSYDFNIVDDTTVNINVEFCINGCACVDCKCNVLSDMNCSDTSKNSPALTLYFAKANEKLWDIAKLFSSDIDLIKNENDIQNDVLDSNKVIIIPGL